MYNRPLSAGEIQKLYTEGQKSFFYSNEIITNKIKLFQQSSNPVKPELGWGIMWLSNGSGLGDPGDLIVASNVTGITKYSIVFDYSSGTDW
jgi:hypothetical protein